jgi:hypothetical protein
MRRVNALRFLFVLPQISLILAWEDGLGRNTVSTIFQSFLKARRFAEPDGLSGISSIDQSLRSFQPALARRQPTGSERLSKKYVNLLLQKGE